MALIEIYRSLIERAEVMHPIEEAPPFTIYIDRMTPFSFLLNHILERTDKPRRYHSIIFEDAVRYGKVTTQEEAIEIANSMIIGEAEGEKRYINPDDPNWSEEDYLQATLLKYLSLMDAEETEAYYQILEDYHEALAESN